MWSEMVVNFAVIDTFFNFEQFLNEDDPTDMTYDGIVISVRDTHSSKAWSPIDVTDNGRYISFNNEHPKNDDDPIDLIDDGNSILVNDEHPLNISFGMFCIFPAIFSVSIPLNELYPHWINDKGR